MRLKDLHRLELNNDSLANNQIEAMDPHWLVSISNVKTFWQE